MPKWEIYAPCFIDYEGAYDAPDFSSAFGVRVDGQFGEGSFSASVKSDDQDDSKLHINAVFESNAQEVTAEALRLLDRICKAVTFSIQRQNANSHLGHAVVSYQPQAVKVSPVSPDKPARVWQKGNAVVVEMVEHVRITESLHVKMSSIIDPSDFGDYFGAMAGAGENEYLFDLYYQALRSRHPRTKFYDAYAVVEWFENSFRDMVTPIAAPEKIEKLFADEEFIALLRRYFPNQQQCNRVRAAFKRELSRLTLEGRRKLLKFLATEYDLREVHLAGRSYKADEVLVKAMEARHRIFHGGPTPADIKELADCLIQVVGELLYAHFVRRERQVI